MENFEISTHQHPPGKILLGGFDAAVTYIKSETQFWSFTSATLRNLDQNFRQFGTDISNKLNRINDQIREATQQIQSNQSRAHDLLNGCLSQLSQLYADCTLYPPESKERFFISDIKNTNSLSALAALYYLNNKNPMTAESAISYGTFLAKDFLNEKTPTYSAYDQIESINNKGESAIYDFNTKSNAIISEQAKKLKDHDAHAKKLKQISTRRIRKLRGILHTEQNLLNQLKQSAKSEFDATLEAFNEHMKLEAPVAYWGNKAKFHLVASILFGLALLGAGSYGGKLLWDLTNNTVLGAQTNTTILSDQEPGLGSTLAHDLAHPSDTDPPIWQLSLLAFIAILYLWLLKILARLFFSQVHLKSDSAERVVLIKSYLAMLKDPDSCAESSRELVLQSIFRPSSTGIVKDDAMPQTLSTGVVKVIDK